MDNACKVLNYRIELWIILIEALEKEKHNMKIWKHGTFMAVVAIIALSLTGCSSDDNSGNSNPETGGTFTVTGIPSMFNGKYVGFSGAEAPDDFAFFVGCQSLNMTTQVMTFVQIVNESVSLPMWTGNASEEIVRYYGNDTIQGSIIITNSAQNPLNLTGNLIDNHFWESITFSNGSVIKTWSSGYSFY